MSVDRIRTAEVEQLISALGAFKSNDERFSFMIDLCTVREIDEMAQRLEVARRLEAGESYAHIQSNTGASATTVARVSKCLNYGEGGYAAALNLLRS